MGVIVLVTLIVLCLPHMIELLYCIVFLVIVFLVHRGKFPSMAVIDRYKKKFLDPFYEAVRPLKFTYYLLRNKRT
jgi:hypothetical protein